MRARALGELSAEDAFDRLYALYARSVMSWLRLRVRGADADDLFQDVWRIFHGRWRGWQATPELGNPDARPVLAFLFRTCHFALKGFARTRRATESLEVVERGGDDPSRRLEEGLVLGRCLALARERCTPRQLDVLTAKLAGIPGREISSALGVSESVVDHDYRDAVALLKKALHAEA